MKEDVKNILNKLPKNTIISILVISFSVIISLIGLIGFIGNKFYNNWKLSSESDKKEIIEVFQTEIKDFKDENANMHHKTDQNIERLSNKVDVLSDEQDETTKRILRQIDKDLKPKEESYMPSYYMPKSYAEPIKSELQSSIPEIKKKLSQ